MARYTNVMASYWGGDDMDATLSMFPREAAHACECAQE